MADETTRRALTIGRTLASDVLEFRNRALTRRAAAVTRRATARAADARPAVEPRRVRAAGGPGTAGVLVAEGDSWFDYPWHDVLRVLEDVHGYDVESVAHKGDRVEEMAYGGGQLEEFTRIVEKQLRRSVAPSAVLLSGGGNDIAGGEFGMLLNHAQSALAGLNDSIVRGVIEERVRVAYITILSAVTQVCRERIGRAVPILVHGYDYPVPDGRGVLGGWWLLPGPWLEPGFREKGYEQMRTRISLTVALIDRFNEMLAGVAALPDFAHVKYVNLRGTLSIGSDYKRWWANELHPTQRGFTRVAAKFVRALGAN